MKITASFDDGGAADVHIAELMLKYKIPTTFYIPVMWRKVNALKGRYSINEDELKEISQIHDIGGHTVSHPMLTNIGYDDAQWEISNGKEMLEDLIGREVTSFCYPRGAYNDTIKLLVESSGFRDARTTKVGQLASALDPFETHTAVHLGYDRKEYGKPWFEYGIELFNSAPEDSVFHFWGHGFELEDKLDELEKFVKAIS